MTQTQTYQQWQRERSCTRKVGRYPDRVAANAAALRVWQRGDWLWPYQCQHCDGWHLTSDRQEDM